MRLRSVQKAAEFGLGQEASCCYLQRSYRLHGSVEYRGPVIMGIILMLMPCKRRGGDKRCNVQNTQPTPIWSKAQVSRKRGPYRNGNRAQSERAPETVFETNMLMGAYGILSMACCHCAFLSRTRKQRRVQPAAGGDDERVYCIHRQGGLV